MAEISIGSVFAGYRVEGVAGEGGMGRVYRATQVALNRPVALKLIVPELADDPDFRARFERESYLSASIDHPNVIPVYEAGEAEGRLFIAMRWVEGADLRSLIASEGGVDARRAVAIVEQIAAALDAAHSSGLVHRDVKPANVLLTSSHGQEHAYLTDFGLTKKTTSATGLTKTGHFVGTPDYTPPEQIKGERADARADVYALGCLLFHAITGRVPYDRDSEVGKMYAHLHDSPPSAVEAVPGTPPGLDEVIGRALAKEPDERFPSAGDLGRASRAALTGDDPSQPERSLATGLAAGGALEVAPTAPSPGAAPTAPAPPPTVPVPPATVPVPPPTAPAATPPGPAPPLATPPPVAPPAALPADRPRRPALPIALAGVLALAVAGGALALAGVFSGDDSEPTADDVVTFGDSGGGDSGDSDSGGSTTPKAVATIPAGQGPDGIVVEGTTVWVSNSRGNALTRLDTETNKRIGGPLKVGTNPDQVAAANGVVWVANTDDGTVTRVDADPEPRASATVPVGSEPEGVSLGKRFVWIANGGDNSVSRIDRSSAAVVGEPIGVGHKPIGIFAGGANVWVTNSFSRTVTRLDPASGTVKGAPTVVGRNIRAVIEGLGFAWVSSVDEDTVTRLAPASGKVVGDPIKVGDRPKEMAIAAGFVWVVNEGSNSVSRIDPQTANVSGAPIPVGSTPVGIAAGAGSLWVSNNESDTVTRIDP